MLKFAHVFWSGTLQNGIVTTKTVTGETVVGENVIIKWKGQSFEAKILRLEEDKM